MSLSGRVALITGASGGLGAHFANVLARAGARVVLGARRLPALSHVAEGIKAAGGDALTVELDVASAASVARAAAHFGDIDILINNAGLVREKAALEQTEADWDLVLDTNLKGMFLVAQAAARIMRAHGRGGSIVNVASVLGLRQAGNVMPYSVSKAGVIQLSKALALEWARHKIRVNALAPGYIATDLNRAFWESEPGQQMIRRIPQRRLGRPEELDGPLLLLASEASAYMTGSVITVDGGHLVGSL